MYNFKFRIPALSELSEQSKLFITILCILFSSLCARWGYKIGYQDQKNKILNNEKISLSRIKRGNKTKQNIEVNST